MSYEYIHKFERLGMGLFVHFGLYSILGKGEWFLHLDPDADAAKYEKLPKLFNVKKNWAKELVKTAKAAGAKYITLTARHHDGFSLYDTCGLNTYDAVHSAANRDLISEFVTECRKGGIVPFFYHTLLDWHDPKYRYDFSAYIDYLVKSIEILCCNYGKLGGFWFDGMWDKSVEDWQEDRLYGTIRKHQPEAMIINNTGLSALGETGHPEIDSVTFERGKPAAVKQGEKPIAGEMCQVLNDHWGYAKNDCNYKSIKELIENLIDCRRCNCNFLLNTGLKGNGCVNDTDKALLTEFGKWIYANKGFIYGVHGSDYDGTNCIILEDGDAWYIVVKNVVMVADPNVTKWTDQMRVRVDERISGNAVWLDSGEMALIRNGELIVMPYHYGASFSARVAKVEKH